MSNACLDNQEEAKKFFKKLFKMMKVTLVDSTGQKLYDRDMRAYLVKDEATF